MYKGKRKVFNIAKYEELRTQNIATKQGAVWNAFVELEGLINKSQLATQYFKKSHSWISQRIHGCTVHNKEKSFTPEEYKKLSEAFRDIAKRLEAHADEIDSAEDK